MSNPLQQTIEALAKEKGIEPDVVISAIEEAVATASRKYYKTGENLKTRFNTETGQVDLFALKTVVEDVTTPATEIAITEAREMYRPLYGDDVANSIELGDEMEFPKPTEVLGRIAAQTAKQVIFQKVREAQQEHDFAEANLGADQQRSINITVLNRFGYGDIILEIGRIEAVLPRKEQSRAESYTPADRVRTVIKGVNRSAKGPQIVLSRTDPALLIKLFEQEVPEIYDGTVMIPARRARNRRPRENGRLFASRALTWTRSAPGRRHEGRTARAVDHPRAARRENRHRQYSGRTDRLCHQRAEPGQRAARLDRGRSRPRDGGRRQRRQAARWPSARKARTCGWRRNRLAHRHQGEEEKRKKGRLKPSSAQARGSASWKARRRTWLSAEAADAAKAETPADVAAAADMRPTRASGRTRRTCPP